MSSQSIGKRLEEARLAASLRLKRQLSQTAMAELVSAELGRRVWQQQWSDYEAEDGPEPALDVFRATARLSGLTPGYLAFGEDANATISIEEAMATGRPMPARKAAPVAKAARKRGRKRP